MAIYSVQALVLLSILGFTHCAFVDTLHKCKIKDSKCHADLIQKVIHDITETGVPELDIPPIDPIHLENVNVAVLDVINVTLIDGLAKGIKDCKMNNYVTDIEKSKAHLDLTCDIFIEGKYSIHSDSPVIKNLLGASLHGSGIGQVKIDKINIVMDYAFKLTKKDDGNLYFLRDAKNSKYSWDIKDKVSFAADTLYLGDKEASKEVIGVLNENWRVIISSFGNNFVDVAIKYVYKFLGRFFKTVSANYFIVEDLSEYL